MFEGSWALFWVVRRHLGGGGALRGERDQGGVTYRSTSWASSTDESLVVIDCRYESVDVERGVEEVVR